jgi:hypothetical protein
MVKTGEPKKLPGSSALGHKSGLLTIRGIVNVLLPRVRSFRAPTAQRPFRQL